MLRFRSVTAIAAIALATIAVVAPAAPASADLPSYAADIYQGLPPTVHGEPMQQMPFEVIVRGEPAPEVHLQLKSVIEGNTYWSNIGWQTGYTKITPPDNDYDYYYKVDFKIQSGVADVSTMRVIATNEYSQPNNPQVSLSTVTIESPYTVTTQPQSQTVHEGDNANLIAEVTKADWASGNPRLSIQKGNDLGGWDTIFGPNESTSVGIVLSDLQYPDDDQSRYRVLWMTPYNWAVYSDVATITVIPPDSPAAVTQQPEDVEITAGSNATFQAAASGYPVPTVTWEFSADGSTGWTTVAGATSTTLSLTAPSTEGWYRAVVTNTADGVTGTATTNAAHLTITTVPTVSWVSAPTTITSGTRIPFTIAIGGNPPPTVQYQMLDGSTWVDIAGASGTFFLSDVVHWIDGPRSFRVGVTNQNGTVWSSTATVDVLMSTGSLSWTDHTIGVLQVGEPFTDGVTASSASDITYSVVSGSMPGGVLFDSATGGMSGQPDAAGPGSVVIAATTIDAQEQLTLDTSVVDAVSLDLDAVFADRDEVEGAGFGIQGANLEPGSTWSIVVHSSPVTIADGTVPAGGSLAPQSLALPALSAGDHELVLTAVAANGSTKTARVDFVVGTDGRFGPAPALADTGADDAAIAGGLALGAGALGIGALLLLLRNGRFDGIRLRRGARATARR